MKIVYYRIEDFKKGISGSSSPVLYDYEVNTRSNPAPIAYLTLRIFGLTPGGALVEFRDEKRIALLSLPAGKKLADAVREELDLFEAFAASSCAAVPGRYE